MKEYKYDFSVVMAVYNVEQFLREAVESLVHQTLGFSRIQLIMVDDGSKDGSGKICDEYQAKYPDNVVVIHKENGGVSSARNAGLPLVKGRYLNFMDSDDKFAHDAFKKVYAFFTAHEEETDVVAVPMKFFDGQTGEHIQNDKFTLGEEVLDLFRTPCVLNFFVTSSFIRTQSSQGLVFDESLKNAEDAKYILQVLIKKMKLGLVSQTTFWYRRRSSGEASAIQSSERKHEWYIPYLVHFSNWALDMAEEKFDKAPKFVQYEVMYDLQWKLKKSRIPEGILNEQEKAEYKRLLIKTACRIDDDIILQQKNLALDRKVYVFTKKYGSGLKLRKLHADLRKADIELCVGAKTVAYVSEMKTVWDFININEKNGTATLEGYHSFYGIEEKNINPYLIVNGKAIKCEITDRSRHTALLLDEKINWVVGFRGSFPVKNRPLKISTAVEIGDVLIERKTITTGNFFPVCEIYSNSYYLTDRHMITMEQYHLIIQKKPSCIRRALHESCFLAEIWRKNLLGGRKAVFGRMYYHLLKPFKRRKLWIISDRIMKADDNGEALFRYLQRKKPEKTRIVFAVSKQSQDFHRISQIGECVDSKSFRHKLLHLRCDVNISSHADYQTGNPFMGHHDALRDLLRHQKFVFLQHGVTKDDVSDWLNRFNKDLSGFVTAARLERESVLSGKYDYTEDQVWLTGFPRFDRLYRSEKNWITVMPTWREYLMRGMDQKTGIWKLDDSFYKSEFFRFYDRLLNSDRLLCSLKKYNYRLQFFPHPNLKPYIGRFHRDPRVSFLDSQMSYRDVYAFSNLIITDYSSAVFDFAYLRKPVIYSQFDKDQFFSGEHVYKQGYFQYEKDGFGEVANDLDQTIDLIIEYVKTGCRLKEEYRKRIDSFFAYDDRNNCKRVTEKISLLDSN